MSNSHDSAQSSTVSNSSNARSNVPGDNSVGSESALPSRFLSKWISVYDQMPAHLESVSDELKINISDDVYLVCLSCVNHAESAWTPCPRRSRTSKLSSKTLSAFLLFSNARCPFLPHNEGGDSSVLARSSFRLCTDGRADDGRAQICTQTFPASRACRHQSKNGSASTHIASTPTTLAPFYSSTRRRGRPSVPRYPPGNSESINSPVTITAIRWCLHIPQVEFRSFYPMIHVAVDINPSTCVMMAKSKTKPFHRMI